MTIEAPEDAIRALEAASQLSANKAGAAGGASSAEAPLHDALGAAYRMGLRLDDAVAEYQQAIGADPKDKRAYYELANLYRAHGDYGDAVKLYQKQLEIEPKHAPALKGLALAYLAQGNEDRMTAALNKARDLRGSAQEVTGDIYLQTQMAFYYLKLNKPKKARAAAEVDMAEGKIFEAERNLLAAERYAGFPTLFFSLGKLYLSVEDFDGALDRFAKAFGFSPKDQFTARLGGVLDVRADNVKELLSREQQAALFVAESPTLTEHFKQAEALVRFNGWLGEIKAVSAAKGTVTRKQMEELDRAALDFVETESTRRSFRSLYIAQKLSQAGIATGLAVELAEQALGLAEAATDADGSLRDYPNYDRAGRLQIFRGRALDAKGWALYKAGQNQEAAAALAEAVGAYGTLPEGKQAKWHLAAVKESTGELEEALDLYIAGYQPPEASTADMKLAVIEGLYRKVNGSRDGLEERLRRGMGISLAEATAMLNASSLRSSPDATASSAKPKRGRPAPQASKKETRETREVARVGEPAKPPAATESVPAPREPGVQSHTSDATTIEVKEPVKPPVKEPDSAPEAPPVPAKPVMLPDISGFNDQPALPTWLDPQVLLSPGDAVKTDAAVDEDVPPPPIKTQTRPRRVVVPKDSMPSREQAPSTPDPIRLRRPPKPNN